MTRVAMTGDDDQQKTALRALIGEALKLADAREDHVLGALLSGCLDLLDRRDPDE